MNNISWDEYKLAYFAGLFDGEGCVVISKRKVKPEFSAMRSDNYVLLVSLGNTCAQVVNKLKLNFGGFMCKRQPTKLSKQIFWIWQTESKNAGNFLEKISPYLIIKLQQANMAIKFQKDKVQMRCAYGNNIPVAAIVDREQQKLAISALNSGRRVV